MTSDLPAWRAVLAAGAPDPLVETVAARAAVAGACVSFYNEARALFLLVRGLPNLAPL